MYTRDAIAIQAWASKSPDNLARVIQLAIVSAHAPFHRIAQDMASAEEEHQNRAPAGVLYGWKRAAYASIWDHRDAIAWNLADIRDLGSLAGSAMASRASGELETATYALAYLAGFHGLGFAKAGFALQMALGISGCLDVHNLRELGVNPGVVRARGKERPTTRATMLKRARAYNAIVYEHGGTSGLWDAWCQSMATRNPKRWRNASQVSALHCVALGISA